MAAPHDQLGDIQKANARAQQETRTVSTVQADAIAQQEEHLQTQVREAEQLMSKQVNTPCRSAEAIVIPAGHKLMRAVTATVDEPAPNPHCTLMFEVTMSWTKQTAQIDPSEFDWETSTVTETSPAPEHTLESDSDF